MTLEQLEAEVLALSKESQGLLLARLLEHLGSTSEIEPEVANIWAEEAVNRDKKMDNGEVIGIPAEEVFRKIRASLQ
jgi:Putative addiction module component